VKKFIIAVVAIGLATVFAIDASAGIFSWLFGRPSRPVYYTQPAVGTRAYSYEPGSAAVAPVTTGSSGRHLDAWDYPKTDSRRYDGGREERRIGHPESVGRTAVGNGSIAVHSILDGHGGSTLRHPWTRLPIWTAPGV